MQSPGILEQEGTAVSAWLTYVQLYVLHAVCAWRAASAAIVTLLLIVAATDVLRPQASPDLSALGQRLKPSEGKGHSANT